MGRHRQKPLKPYEIQENGTGWLYPFVFEYGFKKFKFWRPGQTKAIEDILESRKKFTFVVGEPGCGKSLIAAFVLKYGGNNGAIITATKSLQDQYRKDFDFLHSVKGKGNFKCIIPGFTHLPVSNAPCTLSNVKCPLAKPTKNGLPSCGYYTQSFGILDAIHPYIVTNYAFILSKLNSDEPKRVDSLVLDEAHELEDKIVDFATLELNIEKYDSLKFTVPKTGEFEDYYTWIKNIFPVFELQERERQDKLPIPPEFVSKEAVHHELKNRQAYHSLKSFLEGYDKSQDWVVEKTDKEVKLVPVYAAGLAQKYLFDKAGRVVLLSATMPNVQKYAALLGLDPSDYDVINIQSGMSYSNRTIHYKPVAKITGKKLHVYLPRLVAKIDYIVDVFHPNERGLIYCANNEIVDYVYKYSKFKNDMVTHTEGSTREDVFKDFSEGIGKRILVSPSCEKGLDAPGSKCTFLIMPKVPKSSIGSARIRRRLENGGGIYELDTANKIVQSAGRLVRFSGDYGHMWILDEAFLELYNNYRNYFPNNFKYI